MGQGHYTALVYGVKGEKANKLMHYFEEMEDEGLMPYEELGIESGYEAEPHWVGVPIAYSDGYLAEKSQCHHLKYTVLTKDLKNQELTEPKRNAKKFWRDKVQPFLTSKNIELEPEILLVADFS